MIRAISRLNNIVQDCRFRNRLLGTVGLAAVAAALPLSSAFAGATMSFGDDESISIGMGMRTSFTDLSHGAPNGTSAGTDFNLDSFRLYISASLNQYIKATFDTERTADGTIQIIDGYAQIEPTPEINLWVGRMLPPTDRSNLDGPYYLNNWVYPGVVSQYPSAAVGRDQGATVWGKLFDKKIVYSVGVFEGHNRIVGASNAGDNMLYAGRVAFNILDPEPAPAYYTGSTYYGAADILTVAIVGQFQKDGVGTAAKPGDYKAWSSDLLFEKKLPGAYVVTLEGAYYDYNTGGVMDIAPGYNGGTNVGGITEGTAYLAGADFLFPQKVGWGKFQPFVRYQTFDATLTHVTSKEYDGGLNYIIDGPNAKITADYSKITATNAPDNNEFVLGLQLQF